MLRKTLEIILDLFFPPKEIEKILRKISLEQIYNNCQKTIHTNISDFFAIFKYKDPFIQDSILEMKKNKNKYAISIFSEFLAQEILIFIEENIIRLDYRIPITYIPQHKDTFYEKGFNQAKELAFQISKLLPNILEFKDYLLKIKKTIPQHQTKNKSERLRNIKGSFEINEKEKEGIKDKIIILIDDVSTTGATLSEGRQKLVLSGASRVICFTIAN